MRDYVWAVVTSRDGSPLHADGPYPTKAAALDVKRQLDVEEREEPIGVRTAIVRLYYLMTHADIETWKAGSGT